MRYIIFSILLLCSNSFAWMQRPPLNPADCQVHAPYGFPQTSDVKLICRQAYLVGYDAGAKIPKYVTYELSPQKALGCTKRSDAFVADQSVWNGPTPNDYTGTGYDKGHMSPNGDMSWDRQVEFESFLMTNMSPQAKSLNRGIWKLLESSVRSWTIQQNQSYTIYVGSIYNSQDKKIGSGVVVPHAFYKIVINNQTNEVAAWAFPHVAPYPNLGNDLVRFRIPIARLQQLANVQYGYPKNAFELPPGQEWRVNFATLTQSKRNKCAFDAD